MSAEARATAPEPILRILVNVHPGQRELVADLSALGARYRAERLRALALIGLAVLRGGIGAAHPTSAAPIVSPDPSPTPDPQWQRRLRLLDRIAPDE